MQKKFYILLMIVAFLFSCSKKSVNGPSPSASTDPLVDKSATAQTANLFASLKESAKTGVMLGQQDAFTYRRSSEGGDDMTDMKLTCGQHPLVIGLDFMFITDIKNTPGSWYYQQELLIKEQVKKAYDLGLVVTFTWHFRNPYDYEWFSVDRGDPAQLAIASKSMKSILAGGEKHFYYMQVLQKIASVFKSVQGSDGNLIPCIFRPFHEFDGSWFWWGADYCTPEEYKQNWRFTVKYLRDEMDVHNVLYAFAPDNHFQSVTEYLERYPGDDYVDLVGMDNYSDLERGDIAGAAAKLKIISDYAIAHNKIAALTECGYRSDPKPADLYTGTYLNLITMHPLELSFMMFWANSESGYFVPTPVDNTANDFKSFVNEDITLLEGDVTAIYE